MNCSVSAGPAMARPGLPATGPCMCGLRMPNGPSVPATVAAPRACNAVDQVSGGRVMSGCGHDIPAAYQLVTEPSARRRCGASQNLKLCCWISVFVDLDAQARRIADRDRRRLRCGAGRGRIRIVKAQMCFAGDARVSSQEKLGTAAPKCTVAAVQIGPKRVVRHHVDIMRLGPAGDFHRFGQAADVADVDAVELVNVALDIGQELPFRGEFLADRKGNVGHACAAPRRPRGFRRGSVLRGSRACRGGIFWQKAGGFGDGQAVVIVDAEDTTCRPAPRRALMHHSAVSAMLSRGSNSASALLVRRGRGGWRPSPAPSASAPGRSSRARRVPVDVAKVGMRSRCLPPSSS